MKKLTALASVLGICVLLGGSLFASEAMYRMTWATENALFCSVRFNDGQTAFTVAFCDEFPSGLPASLRNRLVEKHAGATRFFQFVHGRPFRLQVPGELSNQGTRCDDYFFHSPRCVRSEVRCRTIAVSALAVLARRKRFIWYTGAGISSGVVPMMGQLESSLMADSPRCWDSKSRIMYAALHDPDKSAAVMNSFWHACFHAKPTRAHQAIKRHLDYTSDCLLITENLDKLHEACGVKPLRSDDVRLIQRLDVAKALQTVGLIFCIGLSHDDRGLLGLYKKNNPRGTIVGLCLDKPNYLGPEDCFVQGDAQELVPVLVEKLLQ